MKVFIDSDIFLDVFLKREPFYLSFAKVVDFALTKKIDGMTSPVVIANIYYILTREKFQCDDLIRDMLNTITVTRMNHPTVVDAFKSSYTDKEDAIQYFAAAGEKVKYFVTRNIKHHTSAEIPIVTPDNFLALRSIRALKG